MTTEQQQNGEFLMSKDPTKPTAWRYENKNVKGNWYITWTEPPDGFNKRPLYESQDANRIEELERDLLNLVCRIHRDGGHYIAKYGEAKAIADADTVAAQNNADLDALQADNARLRAAFETLWLGTNPNEWDGKAVELFEAALSNTPEQSLAAYRNKVIEAFVNEFSRHVGGDGEFWLHELQDFAMKEQP